MDTRRELLASSEAERKTQLDATPHGLADWLQQLNNERYL